MRGVYITDSKSELEVRRLRQIALIAATKRTQKAFTTWSVLSTLDSLDFIEPGCPTKTISGMQTLGQTRHPLRLAGPMRRSHDRDHQAHSTTHDRRC